MRTIVRVFIGLKVLGLIGFGALYWPVSGYGAIPQGMSSARIDVAVRGRELTNAAGCLGCHWNAKEGEAPFAGGLAIETPIGTLYSTNITPDPETGIGAWTVPEMSEFLRTGVKPDLDNVQGAMREVIEYNTKNLSDDDLTAMVAYLRDVPPVKSEPPAR